MKKSSQRSAAKRPIARARKPVKTAKKAILKPSGLTAIAIPRIGAIWPGQGGRFAGIGLGQDGAPDHLLIAHFDPAKIKTDHAGALAYAKNLAVDGRNDFEAPTLADGALCYATLKAHAERDWYWLAPQYAGDPSWAWYQSFGYGDQSYGTKDSQFRVFAVRRIPI
jgi:hypothetical protein